MKRVFIKVEGIVQGVGFRPFVYNLALSLALKGWVNNNSQGVYIDIEGETMEVEKFLEDLEKKHPPLAKIENIFVEKRALYNYSTFEIKESEKCEDKITLISPDIAICKDCLADIKDPLNRRYKYPFTNCTNCGPRFSIIKATPYDRDKTTMNEFKMCTRCEEEYKNPLDRRFHTQPNACEECGPKIWIENSEGTVEKIEYPIKFTIDRLKEGKIFAVKSIGGFHLVCDGTNEDAVNMLRKRKKRSHKPFAVMMKNINTVKKYCKVNSKEESLLTGIKKPIVLLNQGEGFNLPKSVAPNQKTLGVMLPYTPLHELLFLEDIEVLVMTSANVYGLPIEYTNEGAREKLSEIVDYYLMNNRDIYIPVDDSVVKVVKDEIRILRRARGYAPEPFKYKIHRNILAVGANMKNTFSITKEGFVFLSQHNGDLENLETFENYKRNIEHFKELFSFTSDYITCDMHPNYLSTDYAMNQGVTTLIVQHHHAHVASCMAENGIREKVIGIAYDGTGYGTDGAIWGGEFLICDYKEFSRVAHLDYVPMAGGEKAVKEPWRMAVGYIYKAFSDENVEENILKEIIKKLYGEEGLKILGVIKANINCPQTSSMGRFFDAASSIIGIRQVITYEGQASMELEAAIKDEIKGNYSYKITNNDGYIIEVYEAIIEMIKDRLNGVSKEIMAVKFHNTIVELTAEVCTLIRKDSGIKKVALSGGVFQNTFLLENTVERLEKEGFEVLAHKTIPCNDGGIAFGQIVVANEIIESDN